MRSDARPWKSPKVIAVLATLLGAVSAGCERPMAPGPTLADPTVGVARVTQKDVAIGAKWVGMLRRSQSTCLNPP